MNVTFIETEKAPAAIGPYSQAVRVGSFIFTSGQIPLDPATGQVVEGDIKAQAERALENLKALLEAAGSGLAKVVKTTVFLQNMDDFAAFNEVYSRYFADHRPARSLVAAARLPRGVLVEVEAIALAQDNG
ncbi:MAG: 2-iminobutanoate/2-iminopropanoate deaminase [Eubacteriales bacterium]|nr:2-iminobutanoate/2-iminopropanoate deaminase [Eubacteriales bacterium]MDN5363427.1 2-iminobutanoate/2-iminopropanoate deaminase [Eubacteriales bacterium]